MLGRLDIDSDEVRADLERTTEFRFSEPYGEFLSGRSWKTCMLWSAGGRLGDGVLSGYDADRPVTTTEYGDQLPYLDQLVRKSFAVPHLVFGRLAMMSECVIFPHRDFVELTDVPAHARATHRLHVPLVTHDDAMFMEDDRVFRMGFGEVWFLDVTRVHSAAVLSTRPRVHLILDFTDADRLTELPPTEPGVPPEKLVSRPPLSEVDRAELLTLASVVDADNLTEVFGIVIKKHYRRDGGEDFVWDTMSRIAARSGDPAVQEAVRELHGHCVMTREH